MNTKKSTKSNKLVSRNDSFLVDNLYVAERSGDYVLRDAIAKKWTVSKKRGEGSGNCHYQCQFNTITQSFAFSDEPPYDNNTLVPMYKIMSPALLLYRLICTFFASPVCYDGYKTVWEYNLTHAATGKSVSFSEWKGAIGFWVSDYTHTALARDVKEDLIELLNYLVSDKCAHPYDNLVAGSVA